jgi:hypothetical protein
LLAVLLAYFSALTMGTVCFFKMLVNFYRTTRRHIPEDGTFHSLFIQNFRSRIFILSCWEWIRKLCLLMKTVTMLKNVKLILNITFKLVIQWRCHSYAALIKGWLMNVE